MYSSTLFSLSQELATLATTVSGWQTALSTARGEIVRGVGIVASSWEGSYANQVMPAKDTWLAGISGVDDSITAGVGVLQEWAERAYEVGAELQRAEQNLSWYGDIRNTETGDLAYPTEVAAAQSVIDDIALSWPLECTAFGNRLSDPITTLTTAANLEALPGGAISNSEYYVAVSRLVRWTGVDVELIDPEGDIKKARDAALAYMREHPELFTVLEAAAQGTLGAIDNHWSMDDFLAGNWEPETVAVSLWQYSETYGLGWTDEQIQAMVAQLTVFSALLSLADSDEYDEFDDQWVDPRVEQSTRERAAEARDDFGFQMWLYEHVTDARRDELLYGDSPELLFAVLLEYAAYQAREEMSTVEQLQDDFRNLIFDDRYFHGEGASIWGAALQIVGVIPGVNLDDAARILRGADEFLELGDDLTDMERAVRIVQDALNLPTPEAAQEVIERMRRIADDAGEQIDAVDEVIGDTPNPRPPEDADATGSGSQSDDPSVADQDQEPALVGAESAEADLESGAAAEGGHPQEPSEGGNGDLDDTGDVAAGGVDDFVQSDPNSVTLGQNLEAAGQLRPPGSAAHHIVAGASPAAAETRELLTEFGIDVNSADNGVFLPANRTSPNPNGAAVHSTLHTNAYYREVNRRLALADTPEEARAILEQIEQELLQGTFP